MWRTVSHKRTVCNRKGGGCGAHEISSRAPAAEGETATSPCTPSGGTGCHKPQLMARRWLRPRVCVQTHTGGARAGAVRHAGGTATPHRALHTLPCPRSPRFSTMCQEDDLAEQRSDAETRPLCNALCAKPRSRATGFPADLICSVKGSNASAITCWFAAVVIHLQTF